MLKIMNKLLSTKIKTIKMDTWHKIRIQLKTYFEFDLDFYCTSTLIYYIKYDYEFGKSHIQLQIIFSWKFRYDLNVYNFCFIFELIKIAI